MADSIGVRGDAIESLLGVGDNSQIGCLCWLGCYETSPIRQRIYYVCKIHVRSNVVTPKATRVGSR